MKANMGKSLLSPLLTLVLFLFTIAVNAAPTVARDAQLPIEVKIATDGVSIQSIEDVVIIKDVKANRGNATLLYPFLIGRDPLFPQNTQVWRILSWRIPNSCSEGKLKCRPTREVGYLL